MIIILLDYHIKLIKSKLKKPAFDLALKRKRKGQFPVFYFFSGIK